VRKYHIYPELRDGIEMPLTPSPMTLAECFFHLARRCAVYEQQGHFTNANMERIPMRELAFRLVPASKDSHGKRTVRRRKSTTQVSTSY
jgi:hypothetical protein